jgi:hypothetical protein
LSPRPYHPKKDEEAQEAFKKVMSAKPVEATTTHYQWCRPSPGRVGLPAIVDQSLDEGISLDGCAA